MLEHAWKVGDSWFCGNYSDTQCDPVGFVFPNDNYDENQRETPTWGSGQNYPLGCLTVTMESSIRAKFLMSPKYPEAGPRAYLPNMLHQALNSSWSGPN